MTSPEAMKARQETILANEQIILGAQARQARRYGWLIFGFGIALIAVVAFFNWRDGNIRRDANADADAVRACIATNTAAQNDVLRLRATFAEDESRLNKREARVTATWQSATQVLFIEGAVLQQAGDVEGVAALYAQTLKVWAAVDENRADILMVREQIKEDREANPIPDFPEGTCE